MTTTTMTKRRLAASLAAVSLLVAGASGCSFGVTGSGDASKDSQHTNAAPAENTNGQENGGSDAAPVTNGSDDGGAEQGLSLIHI